MLLKAVTTRVLTSISFDSGDLFFFYSKWPNFELKQEFI